MTVRCAVRNPQERTAQFFLLSWDFASLFECTYWMPIKTYNRWMIKHILIYALYFSRILHHFQTFHWFYKTHFPYSTLRGLISFLRGGHLWGVHFLSVAMMLLISAGLYCRAVFQCPTTRPQRVISSLSRSRKEPRWRMRNCFSWVRKRCSYQRRTCAGGQRRWLEG